MEAKIKKDDNIIKRGFKRFVQVFLSPDIPDNKELDLQENNELTQEQKDILNKGIDEARRQKEALEEFNRRINVSKKDDKIIVNNDTVNDVKKYREIIGESKEENFDIDRDQ